MVAGLKGKSVIVLGMGPLAAQAAHEGLPDLPLLYCMVQDPARSGLAGAPNTFGVSFTIPIKNQLAAFRMVNPRNLDALISQAVLAVPMFLTRWRWNATRSLAVLRRKGGKKVPPPLQRFRADDYLTAVFPAQTACLENHTGDIEIPRDYERLPSA